MELALAASIKYWKHFIDFEAEKVDDYNHNCDACIASSCQRTDIFLKIKITIKNVILKYHLL
jgi:hypothetical protein